MRKIILTVFGSALLAASMVQTASAAEHHRGHKADRATARAANANAYAAPALSEQSDWSRYTSSGIYMGAGH
jgi:Ni/Co efflux regulator RcnB